jgi:hypothetical protein
MPLLVGEHMFLSYTVEGAEKAMKMRAKSGKNKKKQSKNRS